MDPFMGLNKFGIFLFGFIFGWEALKLWKYLNRKAYKWHLRRKHEKAAIENNC